MSLISLSRDECRAFIDSLHRVVLSGVPGNSPQFVWCCEQFGTQRIFADTFIVSASGLIKRCTFGDPRIPFTVRQDALWDRFICEYDETSYFYFIEEKAAVHFRLMFGGQSK